MAVSAMPDGWFVEDGVFGTDIDVDTSIYRSGQSSIHFKSGGSVNTRLVSDWVPIDNSAGGGGGRTADVLWEVHAVTYQTRVNSTDTLVITLETANADKSTVTTNTVFNGYSSIANFWHVHGDEKFSPPTTHVWARIVITRGNATDYDLYIDRAYLNPTPGHVMVGWKDGTGDTGSFTGSWAAVDFSAATNFYESFNDAGLTASISAGKPGLYSVHGQLMVDSALSDGDILAARIAIFFREVGTAGLLTTYIYGTPLTIPAAYSGDPLPLSVSGLTFVPPQQPSTAGGATTIVSMQFQVIQFSGSGATYEDASFRAVRVPGE